LRLAVVWHGAVVRAGRAFLRELARQPGVDLSLVAPSSWSRYLPRTTTYETADEPYRVELFRPWLSRHGATFFSPRLGSILRRVDPAVVLAIEEPYSVVMAQVVRWARRAPRRPLLACFSYQNIEKKYPFPFGRIERSVFASIDLLLGANPEVVEVARRKGYAGRAEVLPTPVDVDFYARLANRSDARDAASGEAPEPAPGARPGSVSGAMSEPAYSAVGGLRIGYVGRFVEEKGIDTLLDAITRMSAPSRLLLAGGGPDEGEIRRRAAAFGDRVRILASPSAEEIAAIYGGLEVLVLPSRTRPNWKEQFGRVLVEAMACGVPVVGSDSGAIPWVIGDAGLVFPEGDADALAAHLDRLAADPGERERLGRAGRKYARSRFSAEVVAQRLYDLLSETIPRGTGDVRENGK